MSRTVTYTCQICNGSLIPKDENDNKYRDAFWEVMRAMRQVQTRPAYESAIIAVGCFAKIKQTYGMELVDGGYVPEVRDE